VWAVRVQGGRRAALRQPRLAQGEGDDGIFSTATQPPYSLLKMGRHSHHSHHSHQPRLAPGWHKPQRGPTGRPHHGASGGGIFSTAAMQPPHSLLKMGHHSQHSPPSHHGPPGTTTCSVQGPETRLAIVILNDITLSHTILTLLKWVPAKMKKIMKNEARCASAPSSSRGDESGDSSVVGCMEAVWRC
jgi:hypothetical protein